MKLLFTTSSFDFSNFKERYVLENKGFEFVANPYGRRLSELEVSDLLDERVVGMVAGTEPLTRAVMEKAKALKVISRCGIGLDNVDMEAAREWGIKVYNTPDAPTIAVAELTLAHILSLARHVAASDRRLRQGIWQPTMGPLIAKQTVGIIGFGRIGKQIARLIAPFGAKILAYDPEPFVGFDNVERVNLEKLLQAGDIITLHLPYSRATHHLINEETIGLMKSTALLINVARGGLIDEQALYKALQGRRISGAALDCFEEEPYKGPLLGCENVQLTPHMGSYANEARALMETEASYALLQGLKEQGLLQS
jgi:D-3-phosphoglycerate dehydrogenase